jgi:RNA polymerase sigma factor (sigma-70 family)
MAVLRPALLEHIRKLVTARSAAGLTDGELLGHFALHRKEEAFRALLQRHGPMVLHVCRLVLPNLQDAEDAFQATFLVLAQKARSVRRRESAAAWLHGTAYRVALKAQAGDARRQARERRAGQRPEATGDPLREITLREAQALLHEQLDLLSEQLRAPLVLCYLEGATQDEAARQLGWSLNTLKRRLGRGRELLRARLARAGLALPAVLSAGLLTQGAAAALPEATLRTTLRAVAGQGVGAAAARASALAHAALRAPVTGVGKLLRLALLAVALAGGTAALLRPGVPRENATAAGQNEQPAAPAGRGPRGDHLGDPLPPGALVRLGSSRWRHGGQIYGITFSPDGKTVASGSYQGTGKRVRELAAPQPGMYSLAFSPDGQTLAATANEGHAIRTWEAATGQERPPVATPAERVRALGYPGAGQALLAVSWQDSALLVQDAATGKELRRLRGHEGRVLFSAFAPDGQTLVSAGEDYHVCLWRPATGQLLRKFRLPRAPGGGLSAGDVAFAFSPDGAVLAAAPCDGTLRLVRMPRGEEVRRLGGQRCRVTALAFAPDGRTLAAGGEDNTIRLWDVATGREVAPPGGHRDGLRAAALSPDGRLLVSAGGDSTVRVWDTATGREVRRWQGAPHRHEVASVQDPLTREVNRQFEVHPWVVCLSLSPDGRVAAGGGSDGTIYFWEVASGREIRRWRGHRQKVLTATFAPGGKVLASGSEDGTVRFWDLGSGREARRIETRQGQVLSIAFSPDGKALACMGWGHHPGNSVRVWDVETGTAQAGFSAAFDQFAQPPLRAFDRPGQGPPRTVHTAAFGPDGRTVVSLGFDNVLRLWDRATAREVQRWNRDPDVAAGPPPVPRAWMTSRSAVDPLAFSPAGRALAVGWGHAVLLYETATGKLRRRLDGHQGGITALAFRGDGATLASASADCTALVWDLTDGLLREGRLQPAGLGKGPMAELWDQLAGDDAQAAGRATWRLTAARAQAVAFLKDNIRIPVRVKDEEIEQRIADLDDARFRVRERATQELERLAEQATPALRRALARQPPLEVRRRIEDLLRKEIWTPRSREQLRTLRAIEVLERVGTPEARQLLRALAGGVPAARLTQEAQASLTRLAKAEAAAP